MKKNLEIKSRKIIKIDTNTKIHKLKTKKEKYKFNWMGELDIEDFKKLGIDYERE